MNRLTDNDKNFGPFTIGRWHSSFSACLNGQDDEHPHSSLLLTGFGWALRMILPLPIKPVGKYREHQRCYGVSLCDMGNGYDFVQVFFGARTHDSSTDKVWCKHLPWKQWRHVRHSLYTPAGEHFYTEQKDFLDFFARQQECPRVNFVFRDYDGEFITASCMIEEREWHRGEGWFKWLKFFYPVKIQRSLDLKFSAEVGPEKGSWKGGTIGHGIDMLDGETPGDAFRRYCEKVHERKGRKFTLRFIGNAEVAGVR